MKKKRLGDLVLAGSILLAAGVLFLLFRPGGQGVWAVVTIDGEETARYSLSEDRTVRLGDGDGYNILQISGGAAAVAEADCGDHTCVRTGAVSREGERIVCLPHKLIIHIEGGGAPGFDANAG